MKLLNGIRIVMSNRRYLLLFAVLSLVFAAVYIFAWNLILWRNLYIRIDLWTITNIALLFAISLLSAAAVAMNIFSIKMRMRGLAGKWQGFAGFIPALFTSACTTCAPLVLSFASSTYGVGMAIAQYGIETKALSAVILAAAILYTSSKIGSCNRGRAK